MAAKKAVQRLPGAETTCLNHEQEEIVQWLRKVKFRKNLVGGINEVSLWKKLEELYGLYERAIRAERIRYDTLLEEYKAEHPPLGGDGEAIPQKEEC